MNERKVDLVIVRIMPDGEVKTHIQKGTRARRSVPGSDYWHVEIDEVIAEEFKLSPDQMLMIGGKMRNYNVSLWTLEPKGVNLEFALKELLSDMVSSQKITVEEKEKSLLKEKNVYQNLRRIYESI